MESPPWRSPRTGNCWPRCGRRRGGDALGPGLRARAGHPLERAERGAVQAVAFSPDGRTLAGRGGSRPRPLGPRHGAGPGHAPGPHQLGLWPGLLARRPHPGHGELGQDRAALGHRQGPGAGSTWVGSRGPSAPWRSRPTAGPWPRPTTRNIQLFDASHGPGAGQPPDAPLGRRAGLCPGRHHHSPPPGRTGRPGAVPGS